MREFDSNSFSHPRLWKVLRFELPPMVIMHTAAAWQEGSDTVKLAACCFDEVGCSIVAPTF